MSLLPDLITAPIATTRSGRRYVREWRSQAAALRATQARGQEPILVYQMGKVGSTTVDKALRQANRYSVHIHTLSQSFTPLSPRWPPAHTHMILSDFVRHRVLGKSAFGIITGVRDPIARNVSAFFQNLGRYGFDLTRLGEADVPALIDTFFARFHHREPLDWFDRELRDCLGIDVFAHAFGPDHGLIEEAHPVLILKTEASDTSKAAALRRFVGAPVEIERKNVAAAKPYAAVYRKFVADIRFPDAMLTEHYGSRYARHFYSPSEIDGFLGKWQR